MSAADHAAASRAEEQQAEGHEARYDPDASESKEKCHLGKQRACWTDATNPTNEHKKMARHHRELAAKHRAASQALVQAETRACGGMSEEDRDMSPFAHRDDILRSTRLVVSETDEEGAPRDHFVGATVVFRATPGMTAEWLQRVVDCHLARSAAVGHEMPEMPYCPLVPKGVSAHVHSVGNGFAVDVRSDAPDVAAEIWRRAEALSSTH